MKTLSRTSTLLMASALVSAMTASAGFADSAAYDTLNETLNRELTAVGVADANIGQLTHDQIGQLSAVFSEKSDPTVQKEEAEKIISGSATRPVSRDQMVAGVRENVGADLKAAGINDVDPASLSLGTVEKLSKVFSTVDEPSQHEAAMAVLNDAPHSAPMMNSVADFPSKEAMEKVVMKDMESIGVEEAHPGELTVDQLSQISKVFQDERDQGARAEQVKKILAE
ncbi:hypothetical protein [Roseovarius arcticus]|uniref:hypothetical protein n=1 Tax=Roseovarius arcticus TaxID=2547404 RepID=UPI001110C5D7|nr:hypothetical protein [Roseovarius arcticus]